MKDAMIQIKGIYNQLGDQDTVELMTIGKFYKENNSYYVCYDETDTTGFEGSSTILQFDSDARVTLTRSGDAGSQLIVERGVRHHCQYDTGYGCMMIGVSGDKIISHLTDMGGDIEFRYSLDINSSLTSENQVFVNVKLC